MCETQTTQKGHSLLLAVLRGACFSVAISEDGHGVSPPLSLPRRMLSMLLRSECTDCTDPGVFIIDVHSNDCRLCSLLAMVPMVPMGDLPFATLDSAAASAHAALVADSTAVGTVYTRLDAALPVPMPVPMVAAVAILHVAIPSVHRIESESCGVCGRQKCR